MIGDEHFGFEDEHGELPWETHNEEDFKLGDLVKEGDEFRYQYDFGDEWQHELVVERVIKKPKGMVIENALCLDGARACPPEDCGGPPGYENLVRVLADKDDEEHNELREWVGNWDAEVFEIDRINKALADGVGR